MIRIFTGFSITVAQLQTVFAQLKQAGEIPDEGYSVDDLIHGISFGFTPECRAYFDNVLDKIQSLQATNHRG